MSSRGWGRPKKMFRAIRTSDDSIFQLELVRLVGAPFVDPFG